MEVRKMRINGKMTQFPKVCSNDKSSCQNSDKNYTKKDNKHHRRKTEMWKHQKKKETISKSFSSNTHKLTTPTISSASNSCCSSFCVSSSSGGGSGGSDDCLGLYDLQNRYNYHHNGKTFISLSSVFPKSKLFLVFLWLSCCCLCPSDCDKIRGKKWKQQPLHSLSRLWRKQKIKNSMKPS